MVGPILTEPVGLHWSEGILIGGRFKQLAKRLLPGVGVQASAARYSVFRFHAIEGWTPALAPAWRIEREGFAQKYDAAAEQLKAKAGPFIRERIDRLCTAAHRFSRAS